MRLKNKTALVTGGSRGIGRGIASLLLESGYNVGVGYKNNLHLTEEVCKGYSNSLPVEIDISNRISIQKAIKETENKFKGTIDILINNAAIAQEKPFDKITDEDWDIMLKINLRGAFSLSQEVIPKMVSNNWGRIINMTSIGGQWGGFNQVHYAASKAALINFTQSLARIYSKHGITSNAVAIGLVRTDMSGPELESEEGKKKVDNIPIGRVATIEEIANTVKFLCSEEASYITGQTVNLNGGMYFG